MSKTAPAPPISASSSVPWPDKARRVRAVFDSVADRYDLMNDLMSGGAHRLWKQFTLSLTGLRPGERALDVAGGTGDLAAGWRARSDQSGLVVLTDINAAHAAARPRPADRPRRWSATSLYVQADAERLPFADAQLRLRHDRLRPAQRHRQGAPRWPRCSACSSPAASCWCWSSPSRSSPPLEPPVRRSIRSTCCPGWAASVAGDADSYRYLAESIRRHPDQESCWR